MSGLPHFDSRWIPDEKVRDYLLNPDHRHGKSRHGFLIMFGFSQAAWRTLQAALLDHAGSAHIHLGGAEVWGSTYHAAL
jgi:hypothetical protein